MILYIMVSFYYIYWDLSLLQFLTERGLLGQFDIICNLLRIPNFICQACIDHFDRLRKHKYRLADTLVGNMFQYTFANFDYIILP